MKNTIIRENLSIEDAKNVAEELKLYTGWGITAPF